MEIRWDRGPFRDAGPIHAGIVIGLFVFLVGAGIVARIGAQPSTPGQPAACTGSITILVGGKPLPSNSPGCVINIQSSQGVIASAAPDPAIGGTDIYFTPDPAIIVETSGDQAWQNHIATMTGIDGNNNISAQTSAPLIAPGTNQPITVYSTGMLFSFIPNAAIPAAQRLNIDGIGPLALQDVNGNPNAAGVCPKGCLVQAVGSPVNAWVIH